MQWYSIPRFLNFGSIKSSRTAGLTVTAHGAAWQTFAVGGDDRRRGKPFEIGAHPGFDVLSQPLQATESTAG